MSIPENPLAQFRTYTYHHILMICDNVNTASNVAQNTKISEFFNSSVERLDHADVSTITNADGSIGKYVVLINSLKDARYSLDDLKWESVTGQMGGEKADNYTSMATEGSMTITEPLGLIFLNEVQNAYKLLNSDPTACVWMIKTIFVGYSSDTSKPEYITNINPLIFNVIELTSDFTIQGGVYNIGFVNINNGSGKLPQLMNIAETIKLSLSKNPTLKDTILNKLSGKINENSIRYFNEVKDNIIKMGMDPKPVVYEFVLDKAYHGNEYLIDDSQQQNKTEGTKDDGCTLDFSKSITIENAIKNIMRHCPQVKKDAKGIVGGKYGYKIRSILNSNNKEHKITYHIQRYKIVFSDVFKAATSEDQEIRDALERNTITFDYIYTGNNTDILDFSMKMDMGIVFFQTMISANNLGSQQATLSGQTSSEIAANGAPPDAKLSDASIARPILPVFFSTKVKNPEVTNSTNPKDSTEFQSLLNRHASLENLNSKMKIHGNPNLLNSINKMPDNYTTDISELNGSFTDIPPSFPNWESVPALAKVNIYMPTTDENNITGREKFWYDGLFYVLAVTNEFSDGLFTQELEMISIPNSEIEDDSTGTKIKPVDKTIIKTKTDKGILLSDTDGNKLVTVKKYVPKTNISKETISNVKNNINSSA